jgi:hypothetical protein
VTVERLHEQRVDPRYQVLIEGKLLLPPWDVPLDVTIEDISRGGARIRTTWKEEFPETFALAISGEARICKCRQSWRSGDLLGVEFIGTESNFNPWYNDDLVKIGETLGQGGTQARQAGSLRMIDVKSVTRIEPCVSIGFEHVANTVSRGVCNIEVALRNQDKVPAHNPYFCVPDLKINMMPAPDWEQSEFVSIRKIRRFAATAGNILEQGASVPCCTIKLAYKQRFGGLLEFEAGSEHQLDDLPDFKLTCITGAGNFPVERLVFTVPADVLVATIRQAAGAGPAGPLVHAS